MTTLCLVETSSGGQSVEQGWKIVNMAIRGCRKERDFFLGMMLYRTIDAYGGERRQKTRNKPPRQVTERK